MEQDSKITAESPGGVETVYYKSIDSTNTQAKRLLKEGKKPPFLVVAGQQTAGRGRQGKSFFSPDKTGIYMSLVIEEDKNTDFVKMTAAAAVSVCMAIEALTDKKPEIKWVNDIFLGEKKICGILCESVIDGNSSVPVIIGIGLNVTTSQFPDGLENAGSLSAAVSHSALTGEITKNLLRLSKSDISAFIDYYRSRSMLIGKEIVFFENGKECEALAVGVDENCALTVKTKSGEIKKLNSGEITVRQK